MNNMPKKIVIRRKEDEVAAPEVVVEDVSLPEPEVLVKITKVEENLPKGKVKTAAPNGQSYQMEWSQFEPLYPAARKAHERFPRVPLGLLAGLALVESNWRHYNADGSVLVRRSDSYDNVPAVGAWQVKVKYHAHRAPDVDGYTPEGNAILAAAVIDAGIQQYGSWEQAFLRLYFPGDDPGSGITQNKYLKTLRGVLAEWDGESDQPGSPSNDVDLPITFGRVKHPDYERRIIQNNRAWDDLGPRKIVGVCRHSMIGSLKGTDEYFRGAAAGTALTDYGVGGASDGALDGVIYMWNDPTGRRAPWANGNTAGLEGDGPAFLRVYGVNGVNRDLVSIERSDGGNTEAPVSQKQFESIARLMAYWADQAHIPWHKFPLNPASNIITDLEHWEFSTKACPFTDMRRKTSALQDRARAIMKEGQIGVATDPEVPAPEEPKPASGYPFGMTVELATQLFGTFTTPDGRKLGFDPSNKGVVSMTWLSRGDSEDEFPAADRWIEGGTGITYFTFKNGWVLCNDRNNEKRDWFWIGDKEGEVEMPT